MQECKIPVDWLPSTLCILENIELCVWFSQCRRLPGILPAESDVIIGNHNISLPRCFCFYQDTQGFVYPAYVELVYLWGLLRIKEDQALITFCSFVNFFLLIVCKGNPPSGFQKIFNSQWGLMDSRLCVRLCIRASLNI